MASAITSLEGDRLRYRGHDAVELAGTSSFEAVAEFLWSGADDRLATRPRWAPVEATVGLAGEPDPLNRFRVAVAATAVEDELRYDLDPRAVAGAGRRVIMAMVGALPPSRPAPSRAVAGRLWVGLTGMRPTAAHVGVLDAALVLLADHDLAVSTLAARVAASARADPYSVVSTGLGHQVYRDRDPRAAFLLPAVASLRLLPGRWAVVEAVLAVAEERLDVPVNVDFALGALAFGAGMRADAVEAMFAVARTAGWLAHAVEEYAEAPLRFRPRAAYTGPR